MYLYLKKLGIHCTNFMSKLITIFLWETVNNFLRGKILRRQLKLFQKDKKKIEKEIKVYMIYMYSCYHKL